MTLKKLAETTGFSISTISKAFAGNKEIPKETRNLIFEKAKELGLYNKYLKSKPSKPIIAIICPELTSEFYANTIAMLTELIKQKGALATVSVTDFKKSIEEELISYYSLHAKVSGIIVLSGITVAKKYSPVPIIYMVYMGRETNNPYADVISADFSSGLLEGITTLKTLGHKHIAFLGEKHTKLKSNLFIQTLTACGLNVDEELIISREERFQECGRRGVKELLSKNKKFTAIVSAYDYIALGAIEELERNNFELPKDISIIGFDDITLASHKNVSLSTIRVDKLQSATLAVNMLFNKIENKYNKLVQHITLKSTFQARASITNAPN